MSTCDHAVEQYIAHRFENGYARSREYQTGFRAGLTAVTAGGRRPTFESSPFAIGTAAADAWLAGVLNGEEHATCREWFEFLGARS